MHLVSGRIRHRGEPIRDTQTQAIHPSTWLARVVAMNRTAKPIGCGACGDRLNNNQPPKKGHIYRRRGARITPLPHPSGGPVVFFWMARKGVWLSKLQVLLWITYRSPERVSSDHYWPVAACREGQQATQSDPL